MIRIFIGYDPREVAAFSVLCHSIHARSSEPVAITPLMLNQLRPIHSRESHPLASTEFAFTRFLTPYLCDYEGWAIFMDCDMLLLDDIAKLWRLRDPAYAVQVVKHDHTPREKLKFLGQQQTSYEKKNWSSVMMFNNERCKKLTADYVNTASGMELHQFKWLADDSEIGELPREWNHLVGYNDYSGAVSNVHFTIGGPYFDEYRDCDYSAEWNHAKDAMLYVQNRSQQVVQPDAHAAIDSDSFAKESA